VRLVPVAPFTLINLVAGVTRIRFRDYLLGTALGMAPGIFVITLLSRGVTEVALHPTGRGWVLLGVILMSAWAGAYALRRRLTRRRPVTKPYPPLRP